MNTYCTTTYKINDFRLCTLKQVDKLEEAESRRVEETDHQEHKPMIMPEPQLMLTAGPGMMAPGYAPQAVYGNPTAAPGVYAPPAGAYQGYGM